MTSRLRIQTKTCLDILARAYYGLPLRPAVHRNLDEKRAYTTSLRATAGKGWITAEGDLTEEGNIVLHRALAYWSLIK